VAQDLIGKVVVVTGGASGIGRATAELCAEHGAKVVIGDVNAARGEDVAAGIGADAVFLQTDVSQRDQMEALVDLAISRFGGLHVMFNNAGVSGRMIPHFLDDDLEDYSRVLGVNLMGAVYGSQLAARHMAKHGGGVIINNASVAGMMAGANFLPYRTSKTAIIAFSKSIAIDLAQHGIRVIALAPGSLQTEITNFGDPSWSAEDTARLRAETDVILTAYQPFKRQGTPRDAAEAVVFLASDRAAQITGIVLPVDGGITAGDPNNRAEQIIEARQRIAQEIARRGG
jgi:NAD(P)-dependent dehydrogenase (short-subunit alcohol dehydrogenase family)